MQAAESRHRDDFAPGLKAIYRNTTGRRSFCQRKMSPTLMVIADVLIHEAYQMAFIENDHMVEQIAEAVANPTFRHLIEEAALGNTRQIRRETYSTETEKTRSIRAPFVGFRLLCMV